MKFSGQEEYGLRCILQVARHSGPEPLTIAEISEREGLSVAYVAKLMALLRKPGLVEGVRGRKGGYVLGRDADDIRVSDVLEALGDHLYEDELCEKWTGEAHVCVHNTDCAIRSMWKGLERLIVEATRRISLSDLVASEERAAGTLETHWGDAGSPGVFKMISPS